MLAPETLVDVRRDRERSTFFKLALLSSAAGSAAAGQAVRAQHPNQRPTNMGSSARSTSQYATASASGPSWRDMRPGAIRENTEIVAKMLPQALPRFRP
jgi:mevalonate pyrophosphate decarboxylase